MKNGLVSAICLFIASTVAVAAQDTAVPVASSNTSAPATALADCKAKITPVETLPGATSYLYRTTAARPLRIHIVAPNTDVKLKPAVLLFTGGGFRYAVVGGVLEHAKAFAARGYSAAIADYRTLCGDGVDPDVSVEDARAAYDWLRSQSPQLGINQKQIVVYGGSAGGLLATMVAVTAPHSARPAALLLFNPVTEAQSWAPSEFGMSESRAAAISPDASQMRALPPTIIFHGNDDTDVVIDKSRTFCANAMAAGRICRLIEYPGMGHSFYFRKTRDTSLGVIPFDDTLEKTFAFLDEMLAPHAGKEKRGG